MKRFGFSKKDGIDERAVKFSGSESSMRLLADVYESSSEEKRYTLTELVQLPKVKKLLLKSNVFIYGKVGFFDYVLKILFPLAGKKTIETIFTEIQLESYRSRNSPIDSTDEPINTNHQTVLTLPYVLIPMTDTPEALNRLITNALINPPVWLIAIPSLLNRSLLLSFNCFFLPDVPEDEMKILFDITSLTKNDKRQDCEAIFIADHSLKELGLRGRIGTVIPIDKLD
jgi:hypothetical protein